MAWHPQSQETESSCSGGKVPGMYALIWTLGIETVLWFIL